MTETTMRIAVTRAFGYSGRYITKRLLKAGHEVITLTNSMHRANSFGDKVTALPFHFEEPHKLRDCLRGVHPLVNTYWVRFDYRLFTCGQAVANAKILFAAAREAGVQRVVHVMPKHWSETTKAQHPQQRALRLLKNRQLESRLTCPLRLGPSRCCQR